MECGVPFCHNGCPVNNLIPDWNDLVYRDRWQEAIEQLHRTNNFPDFTGPALPRAVRGRVRARDPRGRGGDDQADRARDRQPRLGRGLGRPAAAGARDRAVGRRDRRRAGRAWRARSSSRRAGHCGDGVRARRGGRRARPLRRPGLQDREDGSSSGASSSSPPRASSSASASTSASTSRPRSCAAVRRGRDRDRLARPARPAGARAASSTACTSRWTTSTSATASSPARTGPPCPARPAPPGPATSITAAGKHVIVIGGGDTGADCVANAHREGAASVTQIELIGEPPRSRPDEVTPWPLLADEAPHPVRAEGGRRSATSRSRRPSSPANGQRRSRSTGRRTPARRRSRRSPAPSETRPADLVLLAMGFLGPEQPLLDQLGVERDERGNVKAAELRDVGRRASSPPATPAAASR